MAPGIDLSWIYALIQAAAVFIALVGAFFTTKVLTIASERRSLRSRSELLAKEIGANEQKESAIISSLDELQTKWANEDVTAFYRGKLDEGETEAPPSLKNLKSEFKGEGQLNSFEELELENQYDAFAKAYKPRSVLSGLSQSLAGISALTLLPSGLRKSEREEYHRDTENLRKLREELAVQRVRGAELDNQLRLSSFPRYTLFGFGVLVYLMSVTIILPFAMVAQGISVSTIGTLTFALFVTGVVGEIIYLALEMFSGSGLGFKARRIGGPG